MFQLSGRHCRVNWEKVRVHYKVYGLGVGDGG